MVAFYYAKGNGEAETVTALFSGAGFVRPVKTIKQAGELFLGNRLPGVAHPQADLVLGGGEYCAHLFFQSRVFTCIVQENERELAKLLGIPRTHRSGAMSSERVTPCSKARDSKGSRLLQSRSLKFTGEVDWGRGSSSERARKSRFFTSFCMREASSWVFCIQRCWLFMVSSGCERRIFRLARMTVSGVFSSWEASATKAVLLLPGLSGRSKGPPCQEPADDKEQAHASK